MRSPPPLRVLLLLAAAVSVASCKRDAAVVTLSTDHGEESREWELVWADEFEVDGRPDPKNWTYETGFVRNEELQWYQADNAICENGLLIISARRERIANLHHHPDAP